MLLNTDLPITKCSEDKLNRGAFASCLASTIQQSTFPSSFVIGLYGSWGSGKTSLINMILEKIDVRDANVVVLSFNPWLCTDPSQLVTQFFKQLSTATKLKTKPSDKIWELIDQYADIFDMADYIPYAGVAVSTAGKAIIKHARKKIDRKSKDLQQSKNDIISQIKQEKIKIIVTIDDIDRLSENGIIAVFQLVKAMADFPNTVYLLAFDYDVVVDALRKVQNGDGKEYLEKIIQVPFEIPAPSLSSIHNAFFDKLNETLTNIPESRFDKQTWSELFMYGVSKYIKSIRDVVRFTNVFTLKYELLKDETDPVDLLGLTTLQVFEPKVYSRLCWCKEILCGTNLGYSSQIHKAEEEKIKGIVSTFFAEANAVTNEGAARSIIGILFPKVRDALGVNSAIGRYYSRQKFILNNNVATPECFDRYFALSLESDAIPTALIQQLINNSSESELEYGIQQLYQDNKIVRLIEEIEAYADIRHIPLILPQRVELLAKVLTRKWHLFDVYDTSFLSIPFSRRLVHCVEALVKTIDKSERFSCLQQIFGDRLVSLSTISILLRRLENEHGRLSKEASSISETLLEIDDVIRLESIFINRSEEIFETGQAFNEYHGLSFMWLLEEIVPGSVKKYKDKYITNDVMLAKAITNCISHGTITSNVVTKTRNVHKNGIEAITEIDEAYQRMRAFSRTKDIALLEEEEIKDILAFLLVTENTSSDDIFKDCVAENTIEIEYQKLISDSQSIEIDK